MHQVRGLFSILEKTRQNKTKQNKNKRKQNKTNCEILKGGLLFPLLFYQVACLFPVLNSVQICATYSVTVLQFIHKSVSVP